MDKDGLGRMYARFIEDGDESLLTVLADDVQDHVSGQRGPAIWLTVKDWVARSFADRTVETHAVAADGDRVLIWVTVHATHVGSAFPWLGDRPGSGRRVAWRQVHIFRVAKDRVVEHWAVRDDLRVIEALDASAG